MVTIRKFKGIRPKIGLAHEVSTYPFDTDDQNECRKIVGNNQVSFLRVVKPEVNFDHIVDYTSKKVFSKGKEKLDLYLNNGTLIQDETPKLYIYKQGFGDHQQYGLVTCTSANEYHQNIIKKHENTRKEKEDNFTNFVVAMKANTGPVFLTYKDNRSVSNIIKNYVDNNKPVYDFVSTCGFEHTFWVIENDVISSALISEFEAIDSLYVADGHHRSASAARAKIVMKENNPNHNEELEYNFFLSVLFPASELCLLEYNRIIKNLNGLNPNEFLKKLDLDFEVNELQDQESKPTINNPREFGLYLEKKWYLIKARPSILENLSLINGLDCSILQNNILGPILGIEDPRTSNNIDFLGGNRSIEELEAKVPKNGVAFKLYPTSINALMDVADAGEVMPPKSTWFEPKLRLGLITHSLEE